MNNNKQSRKRKILFPIIIVLVIAVFCIMQVQFITDFHFEKSEQSFFNSMMAELNNFKNESTGSPSKSDYAGTIFRENYHQKAAFFYDINEKDTIIGFIIKDNTFLVIPQMLIAAQYWKFWMSQICSHRHYGRYVFLLQSYYNARFCRSVDTYK